MKDPGFVANIDLTGLLGRQKIDIYGITGDTAFEYALDRTITLCRRVTESPLSITNFGADDLSLNTAMVFWTRVAE
jgi:hypothetical protein